MNEELNLVRDLAVILISAGLFTIISRALKQPLVIGYIIAGFLIGPHVDFYVGISDAESVEEWSEIGIIFMMFGLGLEFSFKKFMKAGSGAIVTAGAKFIGVFIIGFLVGRALSWSIMECIFLGGLLSMSSTAVVLKSYEDMGLKGKPWAPVLFGTLVVEDLIAILLMVLLSTMAVSNQFAGGELVFNLLKLVFFLILWFVVGIYVIPTVLKKARRYINDEILLLVSIGLCFGMVTFAGAVGYSSALGAFVMGSILAETVESEHIERLVRPLKDIFGAVFFVSVGMMVSPSVIVDNLTTIILLSLIVMVTHIVFAGTGVILTGGGLKNATHVGFSLAQLGEFAFIIVGVGVSLGVMRDFIYPVIIAVSVLTTFTTPYMIKLAGPVHGFVVRRFPVFAARFGQDTSSEGRSAVERSQWKELLSSYFVRILLYGVVLLAIGVASHVWLDGFVQRVMPHYGERIQRIVAVAGTLLVMAPFLWGLAVSSGHTAECTREILQENPGNRWPLAGLVLLRAFLAIGIIMGVIATHFQLTLWGALLVLVLGILGLHFARKYLHTFSAIEKRFIDNLNEKENEVRRRTPVTSSIMDSMGGYDVHLESVSISADSALVGKPLKDIPIRSTTGVNVVKITRGSRYFVIPGGEVVLYPGDEVLVVGTSEQLKAWRRLVRESVPVSTSQDRDVSFDVVPVTLAHDSFLTGKKLRSIKMREYRCMVISVMHGGELITNPKPDYTFTAGDIVYLAGERDSLEWLRF